MSESMDPNTHETGSRPSTQTRIHMAFAGIGAAILLGLIVGLPHYNEFMKGRRAF